MNIIALVGSLRQGSYNMKLAKTIQERYRDGFQLDIVAVDGLPFYNTDLEADPPPAVTSLARRVADADGVILITPEYNWSIPGVLKNALDWLSRGNRVLAGKPVMTAGVSTGLLGTIRAQLHLREILSSPGINARVLPPAGNEVLITFADQKFDANGRLVDEATLQFLDTVMERFVDWVRANG